MLDKSKKNREMLDESKKIQEMFKESKKTTYTKNFETDSIESYLIRNAYKTSAYKPFSVLGDEMDNEAIERRKTSYGYNHPDVFNAPNGYEGTPVYYTPQEGWKPIHYPEYKNIPCDSFKIKPNISYDNNGFKILSNFSVWDHISRY